MSRLGRTQSLLVAIGALSLLASDSLAQDWTNQGSITSRQYQNQIREGNQIVATDFFTLEYSVDTWIEDTGRTQGTHMTCDNKCKGKVHEEHAKCNDSCDESCTERHRATVRGEYRPDRSAMNQATRDANALAVAGGGTHAPSDWSSRISSALADFRREARKRKTFTMSHAGPCSGIDQLVGTKTFNFHVRGTVTKTGYRMSRGVRTPISETVGSHTKAVASADIVQEDPLEQREWTKCFCKGVDVVADSDRILREALKVLDDLINAFPEVVESVEVGTKGVIMKNKAGESVDPGESKITVKPKDMNACTVEIENGTGQDVEVVIPVGTFFDCTDSGTQDMTTSVRTTGLLYAGQTKTFLVSTLPQQQRPTTVGFPIRWVCLEMNKKEPTPASKFVMKAPQDDILVRLGAITNNARIRGPQDQARFWIYTDKATMEDINKRMFPGVTEGRYATLLWEVATKGGADLGEKGYEKCFDPKLLAGVPLDDRATAWLAANLAETRARDLARYVDGNAKDLVALLETQREFAPGHLATLATAMLDAENADVRKAALKLLATVPEASREEMAKAGALAGLRSVLASSNSSEVSAAVDVLIAYPKEYTTDLLGAAWEQLPSESLKQKAVKHLGISQAG